ncbi:DNA-binding/iron metalloprotein/AP endonuclease [Spiroplasma syrphidicola EA-1]|uniref:tRNA N6-adenosine threonylcarbamoyltransferase n=1 Tax=Spiroplasma syrphidicola EA-1 TaxID=1276229 RepID=R4UD53_9MOLU|nr:tRNA (adenosine(37)-N6)-threonylcarbamoyltransferase complex transferase subunit TsaD [Spiroplasma syrphidicola]AGM25844.1 DNA-binding/iron metalloprotein/AP endonuclease [Spiroplasma syrphidicola EA-1]
MVILAIETSCDETSIAVLADGKVLSNVISSQIAEHTKFGGVVPELASRLHLKNLSYVLSQALHNAKIAITDINYIAYTATPGLIGALHIGKVAAETLSTYLEIPLLPLNHLSGHIYGAAIDQQFEFPLLALLVSGGHTQLILMTRHLKFEILGSTLDDAVGECYDKVARMLGLSYPGGPVIDQLAQTGNPDRYQLPLPLNDKSYNFSFSGLKSAAANLLTKIRNRGEELAINDFCATFQKVCVDTLMQKLTMAIKEYQPKMVVLAGGVSANQSLRKAFLGLESLGVKAVVPKLEYCTDNGAMIGRLGYQEILNNNNK